MIGVRVGVRPGIAVGLAVGVNADPLGAADPMAGIDRDATSGRYLPGSQAQWSQLLAAKGVSKGPPLGIWPLQEASGVLVDVVSGSNMTAFGAALGYQQTATGQSRKGVKFTDGSGGYLQGETTASFQTSSGLLIQHMTVGSDPPGGDYRMLSFLGGTVYETAQFTTGPTIQGRSDTQEASGVVVYSGVLTVVTQLVANTALKVFTPAEILEPAFVPQGATNPAYMYALGDGSPRACDAVNTYWALFRGTDANMTNDEVRKVLQGMGETVLW